MPITVMGPSPPLTPREWLCHFFPIARWVPTYKWRANLLGDLVAALTVTAVAAPEAVSYAGIAGLPGAQGLYTGLLAPLVYAFVGGSPQLMVGPTAIMCILVHNAIPNKWGGVSVPTSCPSALAPGCDTRVHLAGLLALLVAGLQALIGLARLGSLVTLVSVPVVAGFTTGSALLTASSQFSSLLSLSGKCGAVDGQGEAIGCTFGGAVMDVVGRRGQIHWGAAGLSAACIAFLVALKYGPKALGLKGGGWAMLSSLAPLFLVLITVPIAYSAEPTLATWGLPKHVPIPQGLPQFLLPLGFAAPTLSKGTLGDYLAITQAALPLALIGYMGAVTIAKTIARQYGPYAVHPGQELWGQAAANAACGLFSAIPVTGSFSRSAVNCSGGARSGVASILTGIAMALALLTLTGPLAYIPTVARAAIVLVAIGKMVEVHLVGVFWVGEKRDAMVFTATLLVVLFADSASGLMAGTALHWALALLRSAATPTPTTVFAWAPAGGGSASSSSADNAKGSSAAMAAATASGKVWSNVTQSYSSSSSSSSDGGDAPPPTLPQLHCAVHLSHTPDLQFSNAERLSGVLGEALALLHPSVLVLDLGGGGEGGGEGLPLDATGENELLSLAHHAGGVPLLIYGLGKDTLARVSRAGEYWEWAQHDASGDGSSGARRLVEGWVKEEGGCTIGPLFMLPGRSSALRVARELCATADAEDSGGSRVAKTTWRRGGVTDASSSSLSSSSDDATLNGGGDAEAPLLLSQQREDGGEVSSKSAGKALPVEGVPPSPVQERTTRVRLGKGLPLALTPQQHLHTFIHTQGSEGATPAASSTLPTKVANIWGEVMAFLHSSETPRLVGVVEEGEVEEGGGVGGKKAF